MFRGICWINLITPNPNSMHSFKIRKSTHGIYTYTLYIYIYIWASPEDQQVKNPPAVKDSQEMQVQSLGQEDPLGSYEELTCQ